MDDLFLEEDLLAKMMREKLFTPGMIDDIKVTCSEYIIVICLLVTLNGLSSL